MTAQERHNALCNIATETLWGFQTAMVMPTTVLTVLLTQLGASEGMVGLIPSLDGLTLFMSVFGIYLFRSHKKRKFRIIIYHYLTIIPLLGLMGVLVLVHDYISPAILKYLLLGCWALFMGSIGIVVTSWIDWIAHLFRREIRGTVTGVTWACSNLSGIAGALTAGWALRHYNNIATFGWLYLAACVFATLSITVFLAIRDPAVDLEEDLAPGLHEMIAAARESLLDRAFRGLLIGRCLSLAGFCVGPFIALHYLSPAGGALSDGLVISMGAAQTVGTAICCMLFGRIGDRIGHRFGMLVGIGFQLCWPRRMLHGHAPLGVRRRDSAYFLHEPRHRIVSTPGPGRASHDR